jgi:hypothetical protein
MIRLIHYILLAACLLFGEAWAQNISLVMSPNPSPYISDWQDRSETALLVITNSSTDDLSVKIKTEIFDGSGSLVADVDVAKMPILTVATGASTFNPEDIIPTSAVRYKGNLERTTLQTGRIPDDTYQICITLIDPQTNQPLGSSNRVCRFFTITAYQAPILLMPRNKEVLPLSKTKGVMFRWTPVAPTPRTMVSYRLQVMEVLEGQSKMDAFRSNLPIVDKKIKGTLQTQWPIEYPAPKIGVDYVWTITCLDEEERAIVDGPGYAEPFVFSVVDDKKPTVVLQSPSDKDTFSTVKDIDKFQWKLAGAQIDNPSYKLEVSRLGANGKVEQVFTKKTTKNSLSPDEVFDEKEDAGSTYRWRVVEEFSGASSSMSSFSTGGCDPFLELDSFTIACSGYDSTGGRIFEICFQADYEGTFNGAPIDLTYANTGSGLEVYDQTMTNSLLAQTTIITPSTGLVDPQASGTVVDYCIRVVVSDASVTEIHVVLNGDDLSPYGCTPDHFFILDSLPSCTCDPCEALGVNLENDSLKASTDGHADQLDLVGLLSGLSNSEISKVTAEIIFFNIEQTGDTACGKCSYGSQQYGNFLNSSSEFSGFDDPVLNNPDYSRLITWLSTDSRSCDEESEPELQERFTTGGGNSNEAENPFILPISVPESSSLSCCAENITVCVRYSFYDYCCGVCEVIKCYEINRSN